MRLTGIAHKPHEWWTEDDAWNGVRVTCDFCGSIWVIERMRDVNVDPPPPSATMSPGHVSGTVQCQTCKKTIGVIVWKPKGEAMNRAMREVFLQQMYDAFMPAKDINPIEDSLDRVATVVLKRVHTLMTEREVRYGEFAVGTQVVTEDELMMFAVAVGIDIEEE